MLETEIAQVATAIIIFGAACVCFSMGVATWRFFSWMRPKNHVD